MSWAKIDLSSLMPPGVTEAVSDVTGIINQLLTLYKESLDAAKIYQASLGSDVTDVLAVSIKAVTDIIEGFLQAGKVHALFVPMPKLGAAAPPPIVPPSLDDVVFNLGYSLDEANITFTDGAADAYTSAIDGNGGNSSFLKTFIDTLGDVYDVNRPQYTSPEDAVTMTVMLLGAASFAELVETAAAFNRAFKPSGNGDLTSRTIPTPQNVRARVIGLPTATTIGVQLDWGPAQDSYSSPYFPSMNVEVLKYAIIRSTDPAAAAATGVLDFFSTQDLSVGLVSDDQAQASKVIAIGSGINSSFVDDDSSLSANQVYYYCVAWQVQVNERGTATTLKWNKVSNIVKTRVRAVTPSQQGIPPDWAAYGSMLDIVPDVAVQLRTLLAQVQTIGQRDVGGASASVLAGINLLEQNVANFATAVDQLNARSKRLAAVFSKDIPGLYTTQITGVGGNAYLIGELAQRLEDKSDPNRPPFDDNEYIMGVCIVGGGPRLPDIAPIVAFLGALFEPAAAANPLNTVLTALDALVTQQETFVFGPNLQQLTPDANGNVTLSDGTSVPSSTIDPNTGLPTTTSNPVIADNGTAVAADDPTNPNAGNTGVKPIEC
jgi:hypothetical protein